MTRPRGGFFVRINRSAAPCVGCFVKLRAAPRRAAPGLALRIPVPESLPVATLA